MYARSVVDCYHHVGPQKTKARKSDVVVEARTFGQRRGCDAELILLEVVKNVGISQSKAIDDMRSADRKISASGTGTLRPVIR